MSERRSSYDAYRHLAADAAEYAHVPFSGRSESVVLVLSDGCWIPGVRVESAAFSLTIPPLLNAFTTAIALGAEDILAVVASRPFLPGELAYAAEVHALSSLNIAAPDVIAVPDELPEPGRIASPFITRREARAIRSGIVDDRSDLDAPVIGLSPPAAAALARSLVRRAYVPESDFSVACVLEIAEHGYIPGVNVEHGDWLHVLCAERNALGTAVSYDCTELSSLYLSCLRQPGCSPCGACRQVLAELAPGSTLWMDGGGEPPTACDPLTLLPGFFAGKRISTVPRRL